MTELTEQTFADLGVQQEICAALAGAGITHPFPIQAMTLPVALGGTDVIGQAKTGTGKTLGFGIPTVQRVVGPQEPGFDELPQPGAPQALVVVPTRELAIQVADDLTTAARRRAVRVSVVFGGRAYEPQIEALRRGVEIVVGTPGRLLDLARQQHLVLGYVRTLVLDEADEMLDLGFLPDVERLVSLTPDGRQTMLFSATMPAAVVSLARTYLTQPVHIRAHDPGDANATVANTRQLAYRTHPLDKLEVLARLLQAEGRGLTIVFTRTRRSASKIADDLAARGFAAAAIHGDLGQGAREQALRAFRNGKVDVLIATDVAARGIDVEEVTHVVNHECPDDARAYLHRIGRTGRAGASGTAVTFVDWADLVRWTVIAKELGLATTEPLETYSTSEHLFTDLVIPAGTTGRLPRAARTRAGLGAERLEDVEGKPKRGARSGSGRTRQPSGGRAQRAEGEQAGRGTSSGRRRTRRRRGADGTVTTVGPVTQDAAATGEPATGGAGGSSESATSPTDAGARPTGTRRRRRRRSGGGAGSEAGSGAGAGKPSTTGATGETAGDGGAAGAATAPGATRVTVAEAPTPAGSGA